MTVRKIAVPLIALALAAGCSSEGDIVAGGITAVRSACPTVAVPAGTGDITLFDPVDARTASAIDVTAAITNVRSTCTETATDIVTNVTFDVLASRTRAEGARTVTLPYFVTVVRGGTAVTAKRLGNVTIQFQPGELRAQASGQGTSVINRGAATLPEEARERLTRRREPGDPDAAVDPLTDPDIRQAVLSATFETLVGFQLTDEQLRYNATR